MFLKRHNYIEVLAFFISVYLSMGAPLTQQLMFHHVCKSHHYAVKGKCMTDKKINDNIQMYVSKLLLKMNITVLIMSSFVPALMTLFFISYRTIKVICIQMVGHILIGIVLMVYNSVASFPDIALVVILGILVSFCSIYGVFVVIMDYISQKSTARNRTTRLSALAMCSLCGQATGMLVNGALIKYFSFAATIGFYICVVTVSLIFLATLQDFNSQTNDYNQMANYDSSDSLGPNRDRDVSLKTKIISCFCSVSAYPTVVKVSLVMYILGNALTTFAHFGRGSILTLYILRVEFDSDSTVIGYFGAINAGVVGLATVLLLPVAEKVLKMPAWLVFALSEITSALYMLSLGFVMTQTELFAVLVLSVLDNAPFTLSHSLMTKVVSPMVRPIIFGVSFTVENIVGHLGGVVAHTIYSKTVSTLNGMVFYVLALVVVLGGVFTLNFLIYAEYEAKMEPTQHGGTNLERENATPLVPFR